MDTDPAATGTHTKHAQGLRNFACATCHNGYTETTVAGTHVDKSINLGFTGAAATGVGTVYSQGNTHAVGSGYGTCTTVCHNAPASNGTFTAPAVTWGATLNCGSCHGYPPATSYHSGVAAGSCNGCHNDVAPGGNINTPSATAFDIPAQHMDGIVQGGKCNACHGYPPVQSMTGVYSVAPNGFTMGFKNNYSGARLQNYSGGGGVHAVAGHLPLTIKPINGFGTPGTAGACVTCHPSTSHNESAFGSFSTHHVQVVVDTKFKFDKNRPIVYNGVRTGASKTTGTCSNVECHFQKSPFWSTQTYTKGH
jgi:predicted CxxxxCH...CXXCH cytochrome family protein